MANELDEVTGPTNAAGRDIHVIERQIPVTVGQGSRLFEVALWTVGSIPGMVLLLTGSVTVGVGVSLVLLGPLPGLIFLFMKIDALAYLRKLQQKIQADASQIDNYLEQRVVILQNVVGLVERAVDLDKDVLKSVAALRSGIDPRDEGALNVRAQRIDALSGQINVAFEAYPELKAQAVIAEAMRQNSYLQKEITAARALYNDTVNQWNADVFSWPTKQIVAAKAGYSTRIPFTASAEIKAQARAKFF
jgi:LemA protein